MAFRSCVLFPCLSGSDSLSVRHKNPRKLHLRRKHTLQHRHHFYLLLVTAVFFDGSAVAQTQIFDPVLVGEKEGNGVTAMAFGDVDLDGKLDMLMGRISGIGAECYRNSGDPVPYSESDGWRGYGSEGYALALGDLDGDHDLDVVIGIGGTYVAGWSNYVHRFEGGHFLDHPTWTSSTELNTQSVALGDVDGDGDLDLVVGNGKSSAVAQGQPNTLFLNQWNDGVVTIFLSQPDWQSELANISWQVALGDLDGDGDLDAFIANSTHMDEDGDAVDFDANEVWINDGRGVFTDSGLRLGNLRSYAAALGDLDGDGDLDAVVGNNGPDEIWWNDGRGHFSAGELAPGNGLTRYVFLADMDRDGDLDAFLGSDKRGRIWLNDGRGSLRDSKQRLNYSSRHAIALGDVNGDGAVDVLAGKLDGAVVWLNDGRGQMRR